MTEYSSRPDDAEYFRATLARVQQELEAMRKRLLLLRYAEGGVLVKAVVQDMDVTNNSFTLMGTGGTAAWDDLFDPNGIQDGSNPERFTPTNAGWYEVIAQTGWATNTSGLRAIRVLKNGTAINGLGPQVPAADNSGGNFAAVGLVYCDGNDYLTFDVRQTSGGTLNLEEFVVQVRFSHSV